MDAEKERTKSPEKERSKSPKIERTTEKIVEEEAGTQEERKEAVNEPAAKRKKSIPRKTTRKRQKLEVETMGLDDLYNNFKIVEQKVKRTVAVN
ncbi:hypothetical protein Tco_0550059, partial [Tanacetum coccineum]